MFFVEFLLVQVKWSSAFSHVKSLWWTWNTWGQVCMFPPRFNSLFSESGLLAVSFFYLTEAPLADSLQSLLSKVYCFLLSLLPWESCQSVSVHDVTRRNSIFDSALIAECDCVWPRGGMDNASESPPTWAYHLMSSVAWGSCQTVVCLLWVT